MVAQRPLAVKKSDIQGDAIWLCRCGLSQNGLTCDGSHKATHDEQPGNVYHYERREGALTRTAIATVPHSPPTTDLSVPSATGQSETAPPVLQS